MVAPEPVRGAGLADGMFADGASRPDERACTLHLSVDEVRELLASSSRPDPLLLASLVRDPRKSVRAAAYGALKRTRNLASNEEIFRNGEVTFIAGVDEAGRGALAGPLVAAAVMFAPGVEVEGVNDSKVLAPERREVLYGRILEAAERVSVSFVDPGLIDRWGIQAVNYKALGDAVRGMDGRCHCVICDHFTLHGLDVPSYGIPKADATFQSVAAASIVAKVERDRLMARLHHRLPRYNFKQNKGYATGEHLAALAAYGPSEFHRESFHGVLTRGAGAPLWEARP